MFDSTMSDIKWKLDLNRRAQTYLNINDTFTEFATGLEELVNESELNSVNEHDQISQLETENADLIDILVSVTHHDGALEEYRSRWKPIVKAELHKRFTQRSPVSTTRGHT